MRAVKVVLMASAILKRRLPLEREDALVLRAICDTNLPKFLKQDIELFEGIVSDLFPGIALLQQSYETLSSAVFTVMKTRGLQPVAALVRKTFQLYEVLNVRHGLILVGAALSGKSTCLHILCEAMTLAKHLGSLDDQITYTHVINPKAVSMKQLYGFQDLIS